MNFSFWLIFGFSLPPCCAPVCKSPVNTGREDAILTTFCLFLCASFFLPSLLHLFLSSSAIKVCHCLLAVGAGWGQGGGWGYLNDLVCSDSTVLFHCRSLRLISLMDYEQENKNRGRQSENDWTPVKGRQETDCSQINKTLCLYIFSAPESQMLLRKRTIGTACSEESFASVVFVFWLACSLVLV